MLIKSSDVSNDDTARGLSQEFRNAAVRTLFRPISSAAQFTTYKLSHENSQQMCSFILHSFGKVLFLVRIASLQKMRQFLDPEISNKHLCTR